MESVEANIGKTKQSLYDGIQLDKIYYFVFDDDVDSDDVFLPYIQEIIYQKTWEVDKAYMETLEKCIVTNIMVPEKTILLSLQRLEGGNYTTPVTLLAIWIIIISYTPLMGINCYPLSWNNGNLPLILSGNHQIVLLYNIYLWYHMYIIRFTLILFFNDSICYTENLK